MSKWRIGIVIGWLVYLVFCEIGLYYGMNGGTLDSFWGTNLFVIAILGWIPLIELTVRYWYE